jgi:lipid A 4'-phosphatase
MKALSVATILALAIFFAFPYIDIAFSKLFYVEGVGFPYRQHIISIIIYKSVRFFTISLAIVCLLSLFSKKIANIIKFSKKQAGFILIIAILTPGILVHWVMKPIWERARPVNITEFGGKYEFTDFYHAGAGQDGKSFPSGHASMATSLIALGFVVAQKRRKQVFIGISVYAFIASMCRVWQGGHYLSDIVFSALLTLWTILLVKKFYLDRTKY